MMKETEQDFTEARLTRGRAAGQQVRGSVLDAPIFEKIDTVFKLIDLARREAAENLIGDKDDAYVVASSSMSHSLGSTFHARRLQELSKQCSNILQNLRMRVWTSLSPTENFPLSAEDVRRIDPHSLTGKNFFTPAEDDLLLRGVVSQGEGDWEQVKENYLRSKALAAVQYRFNLNVSSSSNGSTDGGSRSETGPDTECR